LTTTGAPPYGPPPAPPRHRRGGLVGPLILIFLGGVLLLQNTGFLPANFWVNLWRLWPVILVLVGIELLLAGRIPWLALVGLGAIVLVLGGVAATYGVPKASTAPPDRRTVPTDLGNATQAIVTLRFGAGDLIVGPLDQPGPNQLATMTYEGPSDLVPKPRYVVESGGTGKLDYQLSGHGPSWIPFGDRQSGTMRMEVGLSPTVPITQLTVQSGGTDARLDLANLRVNNIDLSVGAAATSIRLPRPSGTTIVHISGGAATFAIEVPEGTAAQIRHRGGLSTVNIDTARFPKVSEGLYQSPGYDTAKDRLDVSLETGIATIQVN
jgi:hypothetical protein